MYRAFVILRPLVSLGVILCATVISGSNLNTPDDGVVDPVSDHVFYPSWFLIVSAFFVSSIIWVTVLSHPSCRLLMYTYLRIAMDIARYEMIVKTRLNEALRDALREVESDVRSEWSTLHVVDSTGEKRFPNITQRYMYHKRNNDLDVLSRLHMSSSLDASNQLDRNIAKVVFWSDRLDAIGAIAQWSYARNYTKQLFTIPLGLILKAVGRYDVRYDYNFLEHSEDLARTNLATMLNNHPEKYHSDPYRDSWLYKLMVRIETYVVLINNFFMDQDLTYPICVKRVLEAIEKPKPLDESKIYDDLGYANVRTDAFTKSQGGLTIVRPFMNVRLMVPIPGAMKLVEVDEYDWARGDKQFKFQGLNQQFKKYHRFMTDVIHYGPKTFFQRPSMGFIEELVAVAFMPSGFVIVTWTIPLLQFYTTVFKRVTSVNVAPIGMMMYMLGIYNWNAIVQIISSSIIQIREDKVMLAYGLMYQSGPFRVRGFGSSTVLVYVGVVLMFTTLTITSQRYTRSMYVCRAISYATMFLVLYIMNETYPITT